jgi:hypothetical protein
MKGKSVIPLILNFRIKGKTISIIQQIVNLLFFIIKKLLKKQWVTSQPPIAHFNLNLNYEKFICLFTLQRFKEYFNPPNIISNLFQKKS